MSTGNDHSGSIITATELKPFFFEFLERFNQESLSPLPDPFLMYASGVLENFVLSDDFFRQKEGRVTNPYLSIELLESQGTEDTVQQCRKIAEQCLLFSGYFSQAINRKIMGRDHYVKVGRVAYDRLNRHLPEYFEIQEFFSKISSSFEILSGLLKRLSVECQVDSGNWASFLLSQDEGYGAGSLGLAEGTLSLQGKKKIS